MAASRLLLSLVAAVLVAVAVLPAAGEGARKERTLKVGPYVGSTKTAFRVAFKPRRSVSSELDYYRVRLDWRGGRARSCDRSQVVDLEEVRRGTWKAVRLTANHPRRRPRWCAGTWIGRVQRVNFVEDACEADEICRDEGSYEDVETERRFKVFVRR